MGGSAFLINGLYYQILGAQWLLAWQVRDPSAAVRRNELPSFAPTPAMDMKGTPNWVSPEQWWCHKLILSTQKDVGSLTWVQKKYYVERWKAPGDYILCFKVLQWTFRLQVNQTLWSITFKDFFCVYLITNISGYNVLFTNVQFIGMDAMQWWI